MTATLLPLPSPFTVLESDEVCQHCNHSEFDFLHDVRDPECVACASLEEDDDVCDEIVCAACRKPWLSTEEEAELEEWAARPVRREANVALLETLEAVATADAQGAGFSMGQEQLLLRRILRYRNMRANGVPSVVLNRELQIISQALHLLLGEEETATLPTYIPTEEYNAVLRRFVEEEEE